MSPNHKSPYPPPTLFDVIYEWTLNVFQFQSPIQIHEEIQNVLDKYDGVINHETIGDLTLLEAAINENLRMFGPVIENDRHEYSITKRLV